MLTIIEKAVENFCIHQLQCDYSTSKSIDVKNVVTYIDISVAESVNNRVYITYTSELLQFIAGIYLGEDESDDQTLQDMALETTNMLVGSAKTIASETSMHFDIATPFIDNSIKIDAFTTSYLLVNNLGIALSLEALN